MSIREKHTDKMEEILEKEMYADEGFSEIDEEDQRPETQKVMKQERRQQRKNRRKNWKLRNKIAIVLSLIVSVIAIGYVGTAVFYSTHFFSKTVINGIDCSNKNVKQVEEYLEKEVADYKLTLLEADNKTEVIEHIIKVCTRKTGRKTDKRTESVPVDRVVMERPQYEGKDRGRV